MPWLIKDKPTPQERLFFVHVPRCGGTSLMHHFNVPTKVMQGRSWWGKFGMRLFFHRYKLLESANFPIWTYGNGMALVILGLALVCASTQYNQHIRLWALGVFLAVVSFLFFVSLSFVFTAPTIGRFPWVRRCYLVVVHDVLCRFMESIDWCTGTNRTGYMMHLTAAKLLAYGYISPDEMDHVCSMAIVRNPYSRMVSIYNYNKFGSLESFSHFVRAWHQRMFKAYRDSGEMDEWYTPCHAIPQFEFTHYQGTQLVQAVVKQEELKYLKTTEDTPKAIAQDSTVADLPTPVRDALLGMPHTNARSTSKKWYEYYDQETLDLTYEMYQHDFVVFGYSPIMSQRTDLEPPALFVKQQQQQQQEEQEAESMGQYTTTVITNDLEGNNCHSNSNHHNNHNPPPRSLPPTLSSFQQSNQSWSTRSSSSSLERMLRDSGKSSPVRKSLRQDLLRQSSSASRSPNCNRGRFSSSMVGSDQILLLTNLVILDEETEHTNNDKINANAKHNYGSNGDVAPGAAIENGAENNHGPPTSAGAEQKKEKVIHQCLHINQTHTQ